MTTEKGGGEAARQCVGEPEEGDEREGYWPRAQLEKMNARFVSQMERAIASGLERPLVTGCFEDNTSQTRSIPTGTSRSAA
jgi:hypothetical protein